MPTMLRSGAKTRALAASSASPPTPRVGQPPVDQRDYDDRHEIRATSDDETLRRYVRLRWHHVMQSLASVVGYAIVAVVGYLLCRQTGLPAPLAAFFMLGVLGVTVAGVKESAVVNAVRRRFSRQPPSA